MHEIFQELVDYSDLDTAIGKMINDGRITGDDAVQLKDEVAKAFRNEMAMGWFTGEWEVLNEHEIIDEKGNFWRPDRVIINQEKAIVIDFKFGKVKSSAHKEQVKLYRDLVMKMGHHTVEGYVWYVTLGEIIAV
jgi:hypothetical protein